MHTIANEKFYQNDDNLKKMVRNCKEMQKQHAIWSIWIHGNASQWCQLGNVEVAPCPTIPNLFTLFQFNVNKGMYDESSARKLGNTQETNINKLPTSTTCHRVHDDVSQWWQLRNVLHREHIVWIAGNGIQLLQVDIGSSTVLTRDTDAQDTGVVSVSLLYWMQTCISFFYFILFL